MGVQRMSPMSQVHIVINVIIIIVVVVVVIIVVNIVVNIVANIVVNINILSYSHINCASDSSVCIILHHHIKF